MITPRGYSKDPSMVPEGIVLTLPVKFFEERQMTIAEFKPFFERLMLKEDTVWNFKLSNLPLHDIAYVYFVFDKHIQYRLHFVQYERNIAKSFRDSSDKKLRFFPHCNWVIATGPAVAPPHPWPQKGFQGFRYCQKLF